MKKIISSLIALFSFNSFAQEYKQFSSFEEIPYLKIETSSLNNPRYQVAFNNNDALNYHINSPSESSLNVYYFADLNKENTNVPLMNYWKINMPKKPSCIGKINYQLKNVKTNKTINFSIPREKGIFLTCFSAFNNHLYYVTYISEKYFIFHFSGTIVLFDTESNKIIEPMIYTNNEARVDLYPYGNTWYLENYKPKNTRIYFKNPNNENIEILKENSKIRSLNSNVQKIKEGDSEPYLIPLEKIEDFDNFYSKKYIKPIYK